VTSDGIIISTSGFSLHVSKWTLVTRKYRFFRCRSEQLWNTHATLRNVIALNILHCRRVYNSVGNRVHVFSTYYIEKTAHSLSNVVLADAEKQKKLNVINYKHEYMR